MKSISGVSPKEASTTSFFFDKKKPKRPALLHQPNSYPGPGYHGSQQRQAHPGSPRLITYPYEDHFSSGDETTNKGRREGLDYVDPALRIRRTARTRTEMAFSPRQDAARDGNIGMFVSARQHRTDRFSPILEEVAPGKSPSRDEASQIPLGRMETGTETASTESAKTIRWSNTPCTHQVSTPCYPFPYIATEPVTSPDASLSNLHRPFTALSPTTAPSHNHASQDQRSRDRLASTNKLPDSGPDLYDIMLRSLSEPGLDRWWANISQILRDDFLASRATLSVPSDSTDVENVPWAQMATFNPDDVQLSSNNSKEIQSTYSGVAISNGQEELNSESSPHSREPSTELNDVNWTDAKPEKSRPTLESRHSFAGFPHRVESMIPDRIKSSTAPPQRLAASRTNSTMSFRADPSLSHEVYQGTKLSSEALRQYLESEATKASQSGNTSDTRDRRPRAKVLPTLQMLEMEPDPILNSAGAIRVLEKGSIVHLTREYYDATHPAGHGIPARLEANYEHGTSWSMPESKHSIPSPSPSEKPSSSSSFMYSRESRRPRSQTSGSSISNSGASTKDEGVDRLTCAPMYEDYEQIPASPWSQSPAPSPAVHADPEANPFFVDAPVDEEAFSDNPPPHDYTSDCQIEVIGVDRASSIVHIPLVHPLVSKSKRQPRLNEVGAKKFRTQPPNNQRPSNGRGICPQASSGFPDEDKKTPIAILSILSPTVPYPLHLSSALQFLAPHLATALYNARQHSNLEKQLAGISRRENSRNHIRQADLINLEVFSPSADSVASVSDYSGPSMHSPRGSTGGTPGWDITGQGANDELLVNRPVGEINAEPNDNYFNPRKRSNSRRTQSGAVTSTYSSISNIGTSASISNPDSLQGSISRHEQYNFPAMDTMLSAASTNSKSSWTARGPSATSRDEQSCLPVSTESFERIKEGGQDTISPNNVAGQLRPHPEAPDSLRTHATFLAPVQSNNELSQQHRKSLHAKGTNSILAANQSLPSTSQRIPSLVRNSSNSAEEDELEFRPPTSSMLKLMLDSGAVQEFVAESHTGNICWANSRFRSYRNETPAQIRQNPWDAIHSSDQKSFRKLWKNALHTGEQISHQVRLRRFDGQYRWFHIRIVPMEDSYSSIKYWHGQAMDIHEQHIAEVNAAREKEKAASESKYRSLANSNPHIIFAASVPDGMTFANTQWLSYSGQSFDDALGFGFLDHVHSDDIIKCQFPAFSSVDMPSARPGSPAPHYSSPIQRKISSADLSEASMSTDETTKPNRGSTSGESTGSSSVLAPSGLLRNLANKGVIKASKDGQGRLSITTEMRLRSKSGQYRWHLVQGSLIESVNFGQGEAQWIIACADISDQKGIEEKLKDANATLESETTRKMQFLSTMSHEIRTPLNGIIGNLQFLLNSKLDEYQAEWTYGADAAARGMHDLINDILDVSKAEAKMLTLYYDWFHIRSIIEDVFETLASKANEKRLELCYSVDKHVPSNVKGDGGRIRQVLLNLVSNAIKFTQRGEIFVHCSVKMDPPDSTESMSDPGEITLLFSVQDTGSGFTEDDAKILFRPYSQIDNSSTRHNGGTGLGLLLCKQMVELHNGNISAFSTPGKGSTFTFSARFKLPTEGDRPKLHDQDPSSGDLGDKRHLYSRDLVVSPGELSSKADTVPSSASSDPSISSSARISHSSIRSSASSLDSRDNDVSLDLALLSKKVGTDRKNLPESVPEVDPPSVGVEITRPPIYSILVVCPQEHTRRTTEAHIKQILPQSIPAQVTTSEDVIASHSIISGEEPIKFTHVVLQLNDATHVLAFMDLIFHSKSHSHTSIVLITDQAQQGIIMAETATFNYNQLVASRRLHFVLKPAKPPKFAKIFDPKQENALSKDHARANAAEAVDVTKQAFRRFEEILGNRGIRVLAVEDNKLNMKVCLELLKVVSRCMSIDSVLDAHSLSPQNVPIRRHRSLGRRGMHETRLFARTALLLCNNSKAPNLCSIFQFYALITYAKCDIQMPNKDGYETCREIRAWERDNKHPHIPIIALSANIMAEGRRDSAAAGFTQYTTKPVEWRTLGNLLIDLVDPNVPHVFLSDRMMNECL